VELGQRPRLIEAAAWDVKERPTSSARYAKGDRVFHQKFGYGKVLNVDGNKLEISFEKSGTKIVMKDFVAMA
jgi:DNA helicase-2/ATP-dependent DNA helicase PcrA